MATFSEHFQEIAENFITTALVVDDQAFIEYGPKAEKIIHAAQGDEETAPDVNTAAAKALTESAFQPAAAEHEHELDAREIVREFAEHGVFCTILAPQNNRDMELAASLSRTADVIVLDWYIDRSEAQTSSLLKTILQDDASRRHRTIIIYTGGATQTELQRITEAIEGIFKDARQGTDYDKNEYALRADGILIEVYGKKSEDAQKHRGYGERHLDWADLPKAAIRHFSETCEGLVPGVALTGLAAVRQNTHRIIKQLGPDLDSAYLWQRGALTEPSDAEISLLSLLSEELLSVLMNSDATEAAAIGPIELFIKSRGDTDWHQRFSIEKKIAFGGDGVLRLLQLGAARNTEASVELLKGWGVSIKRQEKDPFYRYDAAFAGSVADMEKANRRFAMRSTLQTRYETPPPTLQLGSLVCTEGETPEYFLCLQPVCDSVRLRGKRAFPFLPLKKVEQRPFDIVLGSEDAELLLRTNYHPHAIVLIEFAPLADGKPIMAAREGDNWIFEGTTQRLRWLSDLKPAYAQRVAQRFSNKIGRIGLDESEWLRGNSKTKGDDD